MTRAIFFITGPRASGKTFTASRLARAIPGAVILEEDPFEHLGEAAVHDPRQHVYPAFQDGPAGALALTRDVVDRLRGAQVVIVVARERAREKAMLVQKIVPAALMHLRAQTTFEENPHLPRNFLPAEMRP